jgi:hypothetical protein
VFLSYGGADRQTAKSIEDSLREDDFGVFSDLQIAPGAAWQAEIESALNSAMTRGAVLVLLSPSSLTSQWQRREIALALQRAEPGARRRNIVPIFLAPPRLIFDEVAPLDVQGILRDIQGFDFSTGEFSENIARLKHWLRSFEWRA